MFNYDKIRFTKIILQVGNVTMSQSFHLHLAHSLTDSSRTPLVSAGCRSAVSWFQYLGRFLGPTSGIVHPTWSTVIWGEETNGSCMPTRVCLDIVSHYHNRQKDYFEVKGFANGSLFKLICLLYEWAIAEGHAKDYVRYNLFERALSPSRPIPIRAARVTFQVVILPAEVDQRLGWQFLTW